MKTSKLTITGAAKMLAARNYTLVGVGRFDLKRGTATYRVINPTGQAVILTVAQIAAICK